jgi:hypothetical protein
MMAKKQEKMQSQWSIDDINKVAAVMLALEKKNLKRWAKTPRDSRGEDLAVALENQFGKIKKNEYRQLALWVDLSIYLESVLKSSDGFVALMDKNQALNELMKQSDGPYMGEYLSWVGEFGCLLTEGEGSDIGSWFHDGFYELLSEINAVTWIDSYNDEEITASQVTKAVTSKSAAKRAHAASSQNADSKDLITFAKDDNPGVRFCVAANPKAPIKALQALSKDKSTEVRVAVAQNAHVGMSILETLSRDDSAEVRSAIAHNPQTPAEILKILARDPEVQVRVCVAENLKTSKADLKRLVSDKDSQVRAAVANNGSTTADVLLLLLSDNDKGVQEALSNHPNTPVEIVEKLSKSKDKFIRGNIASRNDISEKISNILAKDKDEWVRRHLAENKSISRASLDKLSKDKDSLVREKLMSNSSLPIDEVPSIENSNSVKVALATNPNIPLDLLAQLAQNPDEGFLNGSFRRIRAMVGKNPAINLEIAEELMGCKDSQVIGALASNPNAPLEIIDKLVDLSLKKRSKNKWITSDRDLEIGLASNPNAPAEYLSELLQHQDYWTLVQVVSNPNLPISKLKTLAKNSDKNFRKEVAANLSAPPQLLENLAKDEEDVREMVASNPNTPFHVLEEFMSDIYSRVRHGIAVNPASPLDLLLKLSKDSDSWVRQGVAANPNTSAKILKSLGSEEFTEDSSYIINAVLDNPNTDQSQRMELINTLKKNDDTCDSIAGCTMAPVTILRELYEYFVDKTEDAIMKVVSNRYQVLLRLARNASTPTDILALLAADRDTDFREAVAQNPSADPETLIQLSK